MLKFCLIIYILKLTNEYLFEMETEPGKKTCVSEVFPANDPFSIVARVTELSTTRFNLYITIEDEKKLLLSHKKYKPEEEKTLITYNNEKDQTLFICVDNFENYKIPVEIDVKFGHHLNNLDTTPLFTEYDEINSKLDEIKEKLDKSHDYYRQNQIFSDKIVSRSGSFDTSIVLVSSITILVFISVGILQICILKKDFLQKKNW